MKHRNVRYHIWRTPFVRKMSAVDNPLTADVLWTPLKGCIVHKRCQVEGCGHFSDKREGDSSSADVRTFFMQKTSGFSKFKVWRTDKGVEPVWTRERGSIIATSLRTAPNAKELRYRTAGVQPNQHNDRHVGLPTSASNMGKGVNLKWQM